MLCPSYSLQLFLDHFPFFRTSVEIPVDILQCFFFFFFGVLYTPSSFHDYFSIWPPVIAKGTFAINIWPTVYILNQTGESFSYLVLNLGDLSVL